MSNPSDEIQALRAAIDGLSVDQAELARELEVLRHRLEVVAGTAFAKTPYVGSSPPPLPPGPGAATAVARLAVTRRPTAAIERWIGQNLLAVVGIGILLLGVGIGVRWAIEKDYIGPLARVVMGYVVGIALVGFAERLRRNYDTLSSILLGGGMAVMYFVTYAAAAYYELLPLGLAFGMMVGFTAFTVLAALRYDRQIVAHLGLVGAYGVPFLLSTGRGDWLLMLGYVSVINLGILGVSLYREWRPLVLAATVLTWLVFVAMLFETSVATEPGTGVAIGLASFNWLLMLGALLAPKVRLARRLTAPEVVAMLFNGTAYFGIGYYCLEASELGRWEGAFALANALVYLTIALYLNQRTTADGQPSRALPMMAAMAIAFVAVAIPIQLEGPWVTVLWAVLGTLVMYLSGRVALPVLQWGSYGFLLLALGSLVDDWDFRPNAERSVLNVYFLGTLLVASAFAASAYFQRRLRLLGVGKAFQVALPLMSGLLFYLSGYLEIDAYFGAQADAVYGDDFTGFDTFEDDYERDYLLSSVLRDSGLIWVTFYTLAFGAMVAGLESLWRRAIDPRGRWVVVGVLVIGVAAFLGPGLYALSEVRDAYLNQDPAGVPLLDSPHITWRYIGMALLAGAMSLLFVKLREEQLPRVLRHVFEVGFHVVVLWVLSSELIHLLRMADSEVPYKLGLSILWGAYALLLIALGIGWRRAHLRIAAIVLFGVTLVKLFAYDLASLSTVSKTIVLVVLGVLLLVMSFLYTKFKDRISGDADNEIAKHDGQEDESRTDEP